jgi:hypothetical protein
MTVVRFVATVVLMHLIGERVGARAAVDTGCRGGKPEAAARSVHSRQAWFGRARDMMTLTYALLAAAAFLLWWRKAEWGWAAVLVALALGIVIFVGDVDFSQELGIRL